MSCLKIYSLSLSDIDALCPVNLLDAEIRETIITDDAADAHVYPVPPLLMVRL